LPCFSLAPSPERGCCASTRMAQGLKQRPEQELVLQSQLVSLWQRVLLPAQRARQQAFGPTLAVLRGDSNLPEEPVCGLLHPSVQWQQLRAEHERMQRCWLQLVQWASRME